MQCLYKFAALKFFYQAGVAQLVEHNLAKVRVASSSLVSRSKSRSGSQVGIFFIPCSIRPGGGTGRRTGLKILRSVMIVRVRFPSRVQTGSFRLNGPVFFIKNALISTLSSTQSFFILL